MQAGDKVYFCHKNKQGMLSRYPAVVLSVEGEKAKIRFGRLNTMSQETEIHDHEVELAELKKRAAPCSFEEALETDKS